MGAGRVDRGFVALATLVGCSSAPTGALELSAPSVVALAEGLERVDAEITAGGRPIATLTALFADLASFAPALHVNAERRRLAELAPEAIAVANGAFFTPEFQPTGLLVSRGKTLHKLVRAGGPAGSGVLVVEGGRAQLLEREAADRAYDGAELAIQAGPRLIEATGTPGIRGDDGLRAHRTILGADQRGALVLAILRGRSGPRSGLTLFETQQILDPRVLGRALAGHGLAFALNLDGGPSTGLTIRHARHGLELPEGEVVLTAVSIERRR